MAKQQRSKSQKGIIGVVLAGGIGFGLYKLFSKKNAIDNIDYEIKRLRFAKITNILEVLALKLKVDLNVINPTTTSLTFKSFIGKVYHKDAGEVGSFKIYEPITIKARTNTSIEVPVTVNSGSAVKALYNAYTSSGAKEVTLKGLLKVGTFEIPINQVIPLSSDV